MLEKLDNTVPVPFSSTVVDELPVRVYADEPSVGRAAARHTGDILRRAVEATGRARVVIATGNSQLAFVRALAAEDIPWSAVTVFHMDEYVGVRADHPASFRRWIRERIVTPFRPATVHLIAGDAADPAAECERYERTLRAQPIDLVCMGIGENGHLAFNEPGQADFDDVRLVRLVRLDDRSRQQQVDEGHFTSLDAVPATAISLTVPALLGARTVQVVVPEGRKADAVRAAVTEPISVACPATVLRRSPHASLWLDQDSAAGLDGIGRRPVARDGVGT